MKPNKISTQGNSWKSTCVTTNKWQILFPKGKPLYEMLVNTLAEYPTHTDNSNVLVSYQNDLE